MSEPRTPGGPSVYRDRARSIPEQEPRKLAETDSLTGQLRWSEDWAQRASGWTPMGTNLGGGRVR